MPAAQSFIQIIETFLAIFFNFITIHFSNIKNLSVLREQLKVLVQLDSPSRILLQSSKGRMFKGNEVKNSNNLL